MPDGWGPSTLHSEWVGVTWYGDRRVEVGNPVCRVWGQSVKAAVKAGAAKTEAAAGFGAHVAEERTPLPKTGSVEQRVTSHLGSIWSGLTSCDLITGREAESRLSKNIQRFL